MLFCSSLWSRVPCPRNNDRPRRIKELSHLHFRRLAAPLAGVIMFSLPLILALSFGVFLPVGSAHINAELSENTSRRETVLERFQLSKESKILLLPVDINGKKYSFVLDTGSTITFYDTALRSVLGDPVRSGTIHTPTGEKSTILFRPPAAKVRRFNLPTKSYVACVDLGKWRELLKEEIYGVLGMDFLIEHVFCIDFGRAEVTFLRSLGPDPGVRIPITFEDNVPRVEVTFPGQKEREKCVVDTGYIGTDGNLRSVLFDDLVKRGFVTLVGQSKSETISGSGNTKRGRVETISLGNFRHNNLLFARSKLSNLSLYYWAEYGVVTFDFPNKTMYLKKKEKKKKTEETK
jgi:hypothetical protein